MNIRSPGGPLAGFWHDEPERERAMLLLEVARLYHEQGMGQEQIARQLGYSRPTISRMLNDARRAGVVTITVTHPLERMELLERLISARYGVPNVRVTPNTMGTTGQHTVALALARFLERAIKPGMLLGLTTGSIHQEALELLRHHDLDLSVVQMVGGSLTRGRAIDTPELCRRVAEAFGGTAITFEGPLLAGSPQVANDLRRSPAATRALRMLARADLAVIGIGAGFRRPADVFSTMLTSSVVRDLHKRGAVGHIAGRFIDYKGRPVDNRLNDLVVGATFPQIRRIPVVLGVAAGARKAVAIAAAARGGLVNSLILDTDAAQTLAYLPERPASTEPLWSIDTDAEPVEDSGMGD